MGIILKPNPDGTFELTDEALTAWIEGKANKEVEFPAGNVYTKSTAEALASLAIASGGIMESGSNANGEYVKFANGWMICTKFADQLAAGAAAQTENFAEPFTSTGYVVFITHRSFGGQYCNFYEFSGGRTASSIQLAYTSTANDHNFSITAIGRWK